MSVARIQPSQTYVQDEIRRIQDNLAGAIDNSSAGQIPVPMYMGMVSGAIGTGAQTNFQTGNNAGPFVAYMPYSGSIVGIGIDIRTCSATFTMPVYVNTQPASYNVGNWIEPNPFVKTFRAAQYNFAANTPIWCTFGPPAASLSNLVATCYFYVTLNASQ